MKEVLVVAAQAEAALFCKMQTGHGGFGPTD
jgi:hypothetical protein